MIFNRNITRFTRPQKQDMDLNVFLHFRPYMKWLARQAESNLRSAEILYTLALNTVRKNSDTIEVNRFEQIYSELIISRRNLALFQHHDAITGWFLAMFLIAITTVVARYVQYV